MTHNNHCGRCGQWLPDWAICSACATKERIQPDVPRRYGPVERSVGVLNKAYREGAPEGLSVLPTPVPTPQAHWPEPELSSVARAMRRTQQRLALYERGWL